MIKNYLILLICLFFINCKNKENEINTNINNEVLNKSVETEFKPIFIGLSPKMSDEAFSNEIDKLNKEHKLIDSKFPLTIGNDDYLFDLQKINNSIRLKYSTQETKSFENVNYQISDKYLEIYNLKKDNLLKVFNSKYKLNDYQIPTNINLDSYNLKKEHYKLYKDNDKSILVGYSIIGDRYPSQKEREIIKQKKNEKISDNPLENIGDHISNHETSNYAVFGIEIEINYYHKEEIDNILNEIKNESNAIKIRDEKIKRNDLKEKSSAKSNLKEL